MTKVKYCDKLVYPTVILVNFKYAAEIHFTEHLTHPDGRFLVILLLSDHFHQLSLHIYQSIYTNLYIYTLQQPSISVGVKDSGVAQYQ